MVREIRQMGIPMLTSPNLYFLSTKLWRNFLSKASGFIRLPDPSVILHLSALIASSILIGLNIAQYFIGKELQGNINQDGTKMLALQITAKVHELLMLASLSKILWSFVLDHLITSSGLPLCTLSAGDRFGDISYLWSREFRTALRASFRGKNIILPLAVVCTILGIIVGPASATAMAPNLQDWPAGQITIPLNLSRDRVSPMILDQDSMPDMKCTELWQDCNPSRTWSPLTTNFFSFWGQTGFDRLQGMPELVNLPGSQAVRTLRARFRGPFSLYQPQYTSATVQPVWAANKVNGLRLLWFRNNDTKCHRRYGGYCNYKDITWAIPILQPVVRTLCARAHNISELLFPIMVEDVNVQAGSSLNTRPLGQLTTPPFQLTAVGNNSSSQTSVGALVQVSNPNGTDPLFYTCSIHADWATSSVSTTFLGSPFVVDGYPPDFFEPNSEGSTYSGTRIQINPSWGAALNPVVDSISNKTAFDVLYSAGYMPITSADAQSKIEAILAVLIAEGMSWIGSEADVGTGISENNLASMTWDKLPQLESVPDAHRFTFATSVLGYGYGLRSGETYSVGRLLSLLTLALYCTVVTAYLIMQVAGSRPRTPVWDNMLQMVSLALQSPLATTSPSSIGDSKGRALLRRKVRIILRNGHAGMVVEGHQGQGCTTK
ncbi:uncharacterized protein Z520_09300 [Fonsecaea multimorphosa CBS 102226]|uniref:Uncharacterized protein n=1 Tax=Fonsecaea multimorphosa CBS 102226 TaxID=1442371 RepID=A0A0D2GZN0_9EURO|nr:uncharacterized protein Z520_09300 [Fonsecaea multimorphosa CBS 102226]KIX94990.1 hypothetical protein Z520_09300 [Fonsecaea multimorphosa CBS 102226]OAL20639.1 hypothetical protein AYO22_08648 [Fonsecaea multimorphosa]